jgi:hypothetical protein
MIIRCRDDLYNGHFCPVCGTCRCYEKGKFGGKQWSKKPNSHCPLHGKNNHHGNSKLIDYRFHSNGKGRSSAWDDDWSDPLVGVRSY